MEQGLLHIYCGDGKGKTTCATGLAVRCAGGGGKVLWFQFLKRDSSGERAGLAQISHITLVPGYDKMKFTFRMTEQEKEAARAFYSKKFAEIEKEVGEQEYDLLILDEVFGAITSGLFAQERLLAFLEHRPSGLEVVLTGRSPSQQLLAMADYVSEIQKVKHPFDRGIQARKKIEF